MTIVSSHGRFLPRSVFFFHLDYCAGRRFGTLLGSTTSFPAWAAVTFAMSVLCCCCWGTCTDGSNGKAARKESPKTNPTPTPMPKIASAAFMVVSSRYASTERPMQTRSTYLWTGRRTNKDFCDMVVVVAGITTSRSGSWPSDCDWRCCPKCCWNCASRSCPRLDRSVRRCCWSPEAMSLQLDDLKPERDNGIFVWRPFPSMTSFSPSSLYGNRACVWLSSLLISFSSL